VRFSPASFRRNQGKQARKKVRERAGSLLEKGFRIHRSTMNLLKTCAKQAAFAE
jgi:hypothetical protein